MLIHCTFLSDFQNFSQKTGYRTKKLQLVTQSTKENIRAGGKPTNKKLSTVFTRKVPPKDFASRFINFLTYKVNHPIMFLSLENIQENVMQPY